MSKILPLLSYLQIWVPDPLKAAVLTLAAGGGAAVDVSDGWIAYRYAFPSEVRRYLLTLVTNFRGAHSAAGVNYAVNDAIVASGGLYRCKVAHVSAAANTPESGGGWAAVWDVAYPYFQVDQDMVGLDPSVRQVILVNHNTVSIVGSREGM